MKSAPHSTLRLREALIRRPGIIEEGLLISDSELQVLEEQPLDLIGVDSNGTLCVIVVRDDIEGERRSEETGNVLEEAVFYWHWATDFREDYLGGVTKLSGRQVQMAPPRLMILAAGFSQKLIDLASYVTTRIDVELYEIDPDNPDAGVTKVQLPKLSATPAARKKYEAFHGDKMTELVAQNAEYFESPSTHPYQPQTAEELTETVEEGLRDGFRELVEEAGKHEGLRQAIRPNRITFVNPVGLRVVEMVVGPGGGYAVTVFEFDAGAASEVKKRKQFGPEQAAEAIAELEDALGTFRST